MAAPLEYAPAPPSGPRLRAALRRAALAVLFCATVFGAAAAGPRLLRAARYRVRVDAIERQCLGYQNPSDPVVYEEDPAAAARLAAKTGGPAPGHYVQSQNGDGPAATWWVAAPLAALKSTLSLPSASGATVFLGALTDGDGRRRLVSVEAVPRYAVNGFMGFTVREFEPASGRGPLAQASQMDWWCDSSGIPGQSIRVFAGKPDPADPSRFTFDFEVDGRRGTFEGRYKLGNDWGGWPVYNLQLSVVSGPAHPAAKEIQRSGTRFVLKPRPK